MTTPAEILEKVRSVLSEQSDLAWGYVFGSVVRGGAYRDVDVAVMPRESMATGAVVFGQLIAQLEQAVATTVDLIDLRTAPLPLLGALLPERVVVLDRDPMARHTWEADTCSLWLDFRPSYEEASRIRELAMRERLARPD